MKKSEATSRKSEVVLKIQKLYKIAEKYEKIILNGKSTSGQKAAAIKSRNHYMRKILKLASKL